MKVRENFHFSESHVLWVCAKSRENKLDRSLDAAIHASPRDCSISAALGALFEALAATAAVYVNAMSSINTSQTSAGSERDHSSCQVLALRSITVPRYFIRRQTTFHLYPHDRAMIRGFRVRWKMRKSLVTFIRNQADRYRKLSPLTIINISRRLLRNYRKYFNYADPMTSFASGCRLGRLYATDGTFPGIGCWRKPIRELRIALNSSTTVKRSRWVRSAKVLHSPWFTDSTCQSL